MEMRTEHLSEAMRAPAERVVDVVRGATARLPTERLEERLPGRRRRRRPLPPLSLILLALVAGAATILAVRRTRGHDETVPRTEPEQMAGADPAADPGVLGVDVHA